MELNLLNPRKSLNSAFRKVKPERRQIEQFKHNLLQLLDSCNDIESEEHHKNLVIAFLKKTYYDPDHFVNTKGRTDLVIHNGDKGTSSVGVIVETKKPGNRYEMIREGKVNVKAFQELLLYYLRERITQKNLDIKYLVVTNINEWFIFDAHLFEKLFAQNKKLVKQFEDFENHRLSGNNTDFFYGDVAASSIEAIDQKVDCTYFDFRDYEKALRNDNPKDDNKLIALYKLLSPQHLLKLPFANDSNSLDRRFYSELLHIIGLSETKQGSKKIIQRNAEGQRNAGSLLENAISKLESLDKINRLEKPSRFGAGYQERLFNVGLELVITWINRILFLKLMEAQLVKYHKGDKSYEFLNSDHIHDYDDLEYLFFSVLARPYEQRGEEALRKFGKVPYLNSSLFESASIEDETILVSNLRDEKKIPILSTTVLKDQNGKKRTGELETLEYLFAFLNAYDFSSEGGEEIQEENKTLINASVLGLIFEKINGYKDGSFFTPGFITMYMSRETIRRAVVQKFNETKGWDCKTIDDLYDRIDDRDEANKIINSLKICDPAVGSGHFLVSALNEIVAIKHDLRVLQDRDGRRLKEYGVEVANDELVITDEDGDLFEYRPGNKESQRVQETLFHEKQTIIENCLFGVDINPNSVKICRLRLWIELLKNAYYVQTPSPAGGGREGALETLPNIDINIKEGNSLISRFDIDADLKKALRKSDGNWTIEGYRSAVATYRNAQSKEQKHQMERLIEDIKSNFRSEISLHDPKIRKLQKLKNELNTLTNQGQLFEMGKREKAAWNKKVKKLNDDIKKREAEIEEIRNNKIYENAFEWRFEFPEVLDDDGNFVGFDVVIGNPPYGRYLGLDAKTKNHLRLKGIYGPTGDVAEFFINRVSKGLLKETFEFSFIVPKGLSYVKSWGRMRGLFLNDVPIIKAIDTSRSFNEAAYEMMIFVASHEKKSIIESGVLTELLYDIKKVDIELYERGIFFFGFPNNSLSIADKILNNSRPVTDFYESWYGKGGMTPKTNRRHNGVKVLTGKEVQRFFIREIEEPWYVESSLLNDEDIGRTEIEKVVVQDIVAHITKPVPHIKLAAAIDVENQFCLNTVMCFASKGDYSNNFLVGVINSKLMAFYFYYFVYNQAIRTMHFMPGYADKLPIPPKTSTCDDIKEKVTQILTLKKQDPAADTSALEAEIDRLVYELYGLTEEEIQIVEESVG